MCDVIYIRLCGDPTCVSRCTPPLDTRANPQAGQQESHHAAFNHRLRVLASLL